MSREIAIRVPSEIGAWLRQKSGSATETVLAIAGDVYKRRQHVTLADPGAGDDRMKIRLEPRALRFIRAATHSRDTTAAVRKLLRWGFEGGALPASGSYSRPLPSPHSAPAARVELARSLSPARQSVSESLITCDGRTIEFSGMGHPVLGDAALPLARNAAPEPLGSQVPAPVSRAVEAIPLPVLAVGLPVALLVGAYFLLKWVSGLASARKVAAGMATAVKVAPSVAVWTPQAATGLGALLL